MTQLAFASGFAIGIMVGYAIGVIGWILNSKR